MQAHRGGALIMANMSLQKNPMPEQDPQVRATNFKEVALGYTAEIAMDEAQRCLHCKNAPCVTGCPVNVPIPDFIDRIKAPSAAVCVRRNPSARANVSEGSRVSRWVSDVLKDLLQILPWPRDQPKLKRRPHAENGLP